MVELRVFGAGVFGLSIAWEAARRGARVEVVDPFGVAAGAGFTVTRIPGYGRKRHMTQGVLS